MKLVIEIANIIKNFPSCYKYKLCREVYKIAYDLLIVITSSINNISTRGNQSKKFIILTMLVIVASKQYKVWQKQLHQNNSIKSKWSVILLKKNITTINSMFASYMEYFKQRNFKQIFTLSTFYNKEGNYAN